MSDRAVRQAFALADKNLAPILESLKAGSPNNRDIRQRLGLSPPAATSTLKQLQRLSRMGIIMKKEERWMLCE